MYLACLEMWRAQAGQVVKETQNDSDDDWETEADYENQLGDTEQMKQARAVGDRLSGKVVQETLLYIIYSLI